MRPRYLTKSRFKLGLDCPTKLFYTGKNAIYPNRNADNEFLQFLAEGGFQVGKLAQCYYPEGIEVESIDHATALAQTDELMQRTDVVIFEAAFRHEDLFVRVDVLVKRGDAIQLIEVKAKSMDPDDPAKSFMGSRGGIRSGWVEYLYDIAFQQHVFINAYPAHEPFTQAYLMLADTSKTASVDGLNQRFIVDASRRVQTRGDVTPEGLGEPILTAFPVDEIITHIKNEDCVKRNGYPFDVFIRHLAAHYTQDRKIEPVLTAECKACEFKATPDEERAGMLSGFKECWKEAAGFTDEDFSRPQIIDIWRFRGKDDFISKGLYFQTDIPDEFPFDGKSGPRQRLQVAVCTGKQAPVWLDVAGIRQTLAEWHFPLHFIDFETMRVAVPFFSGQRPYTQIAFQFSHHVVEQDGSIRHAGEWINSREGFYPNVEFVRQLRKQLGDEGGTIFRYAMHENSVLLEIADELRHSREADRHELIAWIQSITTGGKRAMVDMLEVVKNHFYHSSMKGSNSIKAVLPAILNSSAFLKETYMQPVYGTEALPSHNFSHFQWVVVDEDGTVLNPYNRLSTVLEEITDPDLRQAMVDDFTIDEDFIVKEGGSAMSAYAKTQFCGIPAVERTAILSALLKYCELDTFAMVLLYQFLKKAGEMDAESIKPTTH